jgi:hydroxymethylpyrimidine kinase/phosphomethylpyrimidine kinase/thiamine-phosphate diphosphorylase
MKSSVAWTIAGSDSSGGAGIQSDLATFKMLDVQGCSIITAVTAQSISHISDVFYLHGEAVLTQIEALASEHYPSAIKIGMVGHSSIISVLQDFLSRYSGFVVLDPLLFSSSGHSLFSSSLNDYFLNLRRLFPFVDLLTPNLREAEFLLDRKISSRDDIKRAGSDLLAMGVSSVLIKGGHGTGENSSDFWTNGHESCWLITPRHENINCHGTGCALSAAIAAAMASGETIQDALVLAKMYVSRGIRLSCQTHAPSFFIHQYGWSDTQLDLPAVSMVDDNVDTPEFHKLDLYGVGLYPIVDNVSLLQDLFANGIRCVQLRVKQLYGRLLLEVVAEAVSIAKKYKAKLFVNDHWREAVQCGAYGVHLGQEDLIDADIDVIHQAGLRLGISTHSYYELARAHFYKPSYIAFGPIFPTTSKKMIFAPQGIAKLASIRRLINYPLVAIGGINAINILEVKAIGVDGVALISAVTHAREPVLAARQLLGMLSHETADRL